MGKKEHVRVEPIFNIETPILFAHRGGVLEKPESTIIAFNHALNNARADILEIDVQLTRDGQFVVWHGPELSNVRIEGVSDRPAARERNKIHNFDWHELDGKAWVADPDIKSLPEEDIDLSNVPKEDGRSLLRFTDFLMKFPNVRLNIELKKSFKRKINDSNRKGLKDNIIAFTEILDSDNQSRTKLVVSAFEDYIKEFRKLNGKKYPTGLSPLEQLVLQLSQVDMKNRALETTHSSLFSSSHIIKKVRELGGSTFVFLTEFGPFLPAIDYKMPISKQEIFGILDRGVDGIMTDRPKAVRDILNLWK